MAIGKHFVASAEHFMASAKHFVASGRARMAVGKHFMAIGKARMAITKHFMASAEARMAREGVQKAWRERIIDLAYCARQAPMGPRRTSDRIPSRCRTSCR